MLIDKIMYKNKNDNSIQLFGSITATNLREELKKLKTYCDENGGIQNHPDIAMIYGRCFVLMENEDFSGGVHRLLADRENTVNEKGYTADPYSPENLFCARLALGLVDPTKPAHAGWQFWSVLLPQVFAGSGCQLVRVLFAESTDDYPPYGEALLGKSGSTGIPTYLIHYKLVRKKVIELGLETLKARAEPTTAKKTIYEVRGENPDQYYVLNIKTLSDDELRRVIAFDDQDKAFWTAAHDTTNPVGVLKDIQNYYQFFRKMLGVFNAYRTENRSGNATSETEISTAGQMAFAPFKDVLCSEQYGKFHKLLMTQNKQTRVPALDFLIYLRTIYTRVGKSGKEQITKTIGSHADYDSCFNSNSERLKLALNALKGKDLDEADCILGFPFPFPWPEPDNLCGRDGILSAESVTDLSTLCRFVNETKEVKRDAIEKCRDYFTTYKGFFNFVYALNPEKRHSFIKIFLSEEALISVAEPFSPDEAKWACKACDLAGEDVADSLKIDIYRLYIGDKASIEFEIFSLFIETVLKFPLNKQIEVYTKIEDLPEFLKKNDQAKLEEISRNFHFNGPQKIFYVKYNLPAILLLKLFPSNAIDMFKASDRDRCQKFIAQFKEENGILLLEVFTRELQRRNNSFENAFIEALSLVQSKAKKGDNLDQLFVSLCQQSTQFALEFHYLLKEVPSHFVARMDNMTLCAKMCEQYGEEVFKKGLLGLEPTLRVQKIMACIEQGMLSRMHEGQALFNNDERYSLTKEMLTSSKVVKNINTYKTAVALTRDFTTEQCKDIQEIVSNDISSHICTMTDLQDCLSLFSDVSYRQRVIKNLLDKKPVFFLGKNNNNERNVEKMFEMLCPNLLTVEELAKAFGAIWDRFREMCVLYLLRRYGTNKDNPMSSVNDVLRFYVANSYATNNTELWRIAFIEDEISRSEAYLKHDSSYRSFSTFAKWVVYGTRYGVKLVEMFPVFQKKFEQFKRICTCMHPLKSFPSDVDFLSTFVSSWRAGQIDASAAQKGWELAWMSTNTEVEMERFAFKLVQEFSEGQLLSLYFHESKMRFWTILRINETQFVRGYIRSLVDQGASACRLDVILKLHHDHPDVAFSDKLLLIPNEFLFPHQTLKLMAGLGKDDRLHVMTQQQSFSRAFDDFKVVYRQIISCMIFGEIRYYFKLQEINSVNGYINMQHLSNHFLQDEMANKAWMFADRRKIDEITNEGYDLLPWYRRWGNARYRLYDKTFDLLNKPNELPSSTTKKGMFSQYELLDENEKSFVKISAVVGGVIGMGLAAGMSAFFYEDVLAIVDEPPLKLNNDAAIAMTFVICAIGGSLFFGLATYLMAAKLTISNRTHASSGCSIR